MNQQFLSAEKFWSRPTVFWAPQKSVFNQPPKTFDFRFNLSIIFHGPQVVLQRICETSRLDSRRELTSEALGRLEHITRLVVSCESFHLLEFIQALPRKMISIFKSAEVAGVDIF